jgi:hypothetical protein
MTRVVLLLGVASSILSTSAAIHMASGGMPIDATSECIIIVVGTGAGGRLMDGLLDDCWQQLAVLIASKKRRRCCVRMHVVVVVVVVVGLIGCCCCLAWFGWLVDFCLLLSLLSSFVSVSLALFCWLWAG